VLGVDRIEAENKNCFQSFHLRQSISGGTGSGMGTCEKPLTAASGR
jgi:hypothetical protein